MVAQRANDDIVLVANGEGACKWCCARRRHGCEHQRKELPGEAMARKALRGQVKQLLYELGQLWKAAKTMVGAVAWLSRNVWVRKL